MGKILEDIAERFELPMEAMTTLPRITLSGDKQVLVENHQSLLEYTGQQVVLGCGRLRLRIRGEGLVLRAMEAEMILISGQIFGVDME